MSDIRQTIYTLFVLMALVAAALGSASKPTPKNTPAFGKLSVKSRILMTVRS